MCRSNIPERISCSYEFPKSELCICRIDLLYIVLPILAGMCSMQMKRKIPLYQVNHHELNNVSDGVEDGHHRKGVNEPPTNHLNHSMADRRDTIGLVFMSLGILPDLV